MRSPQPARSPPEQALTTRTRRPWPPRSTPHGPRTSSCWSATAWATSEVTLARYYGKGAAGRLNMDRLPFRGSSIHYVLQPGPRPELRCPTTPATPPRPRPRGRRASGRSDGRLSQGPSTADNVPGSNAGYTHLHGDRPRPRARPRATSPPPTSPTRRRPAPSSHISQRACQGPADTRTSVRRRRPRRRTRPAWARSPSSRSTRASTSTWAAARAGYQREARRRRPATTSSPTPRPRATRYLDDQGRRWPRSHARAGGARKKLIGLFNPAT